MFRFDSDDGLVLSRVLPIALTNGNDGRGHKFYKSNDRRKQIESLLFTERRTPFAFPVFVQLTRILGKGERLWDFDSVLRGNAKELLDALVALGWFKNDDPRYIHGCYGTQDASNRSLGPRTGIMVWRSDAHE